GAAWFRHQGRQARQALAGGAGAVDLGAGQRAPDRPDTLEDTYALFTGGRALSENLQLDRLLPPRDPNREQQEVSLASVRGVRPVPRRGCGRGGAVGGQGRRGAGEAPARADRAGAAARAAGETGGRRGGRRALHRRRLARPLRLRLRGAGGGLGRGGDELESP